MHIKNNIVIRKWLYFDLSSSSSFKYNPALFSPGKGKGIPVVCLIDDPYVNNTTSIVKNTSTTTTIIIISRSILIN